MNKGFKVWLLYTFNVRTAVNITLFTNDSIRIIRASTALKVGLVMWLLNYAFSYSEIADDNLWLILYALDVGMVICCGIAAQFLGFTGFFVATAFSSAIFVISWAMQFSRYVLNKESSIIELGPLTKFCGIDCGVTIYVDYVSYSFALLTSLIGSCVYLYAFSYMRFEKNILNFLVYFKLFGWSMILLVISGSWFALLLGWELIGITSFLLINFWTSKIATLKSAFKAFIFNKISDAALIAAICVSLSSGGLYMNCSMAFASHLAASQINVCGATISYASVFLTLLITASFCKSAQFGFHFWLPDSMEAPVPASALIHSATLVSAGIYLLLRYNSLFFVCANLQTAFLLVTAFTAFYGAVIASYQTDVKKILAYSTISHCGMLMFSIPMHVPFITIFYLFAHGFFKSINFMCVGNFIQSANNYQDTSRMGRFFALFKFEFYFFVITLFNLSSGPLFFCFFSKHWLIGMSFTNGLIGLSTVCMVYAAAFCGAFYSSKLLFECTLAHKRAHSSVYSTYSVTTSYRVFRRSNALGRLAMLVLFLTSFIVLYALWLDSSAGLKTLSDGYMAVTGRDVSASMYAAHVWFSSALAIIALCYVSFKRGGMNWSNTVAYAVAISALALIV